MDCVAWRATVPRITKSWTLSDYAFSCTVYHRKLYLILYNDVYGERIWKNVGMYITGSLYCTPETNSINQLYSDKNLKRKERGIEGDEKGLQMFPNAVRQWGTSVLVSGFVLLVLFSSVQLLSCVWLFETPWTTARQASLSITNSQSLLKLMSIESVMPSNHLTLCHPLLLLPSIFPASGSFQISQFFASGDQSIGVSASTSVLSMNTQDWPPLGWTGWISCSPRDSQKSSPTPQSKASVLQHSAFFIVQLSHPYMTTGKTIALTRQIFAGKVTSLLFNMLLGWS